MRIKFTRVLYVEDELDIPLKSIEEDYDGDIEEALKAKYIVSDNCKIKDIIFEDIEEGKLDEEDKTYIRIFGKPVAHVGRRMGIALCYDDIDTDIDKLRERTKAVAQAVLGTDPYMKK